MGHCILRLFTVFVDLDDTVLFGRFISIDHIAEIQVSPVKGDVVKKHVELVVSLN